MASVNLRSRVDSEGNLILKVSSDFYNKEVEIVITVVDDTVIGERSTEGSGWSEGFFERTAGKWEGELERPDQGEFDKRDWFD